VIRDSEKSVQNIPAIWPVADHITHNHSLKKPHMFLFFLAEYLTITEKTFDSVLAANHGNYLLVKLWHQSCSRSQEFAPVWSEFANAAPALSNLKYGEIECTENAKLCARLIGTSYPQVVWFDPEVNATVTFSGDRSVNGLCSFVHTMQLYPFRIGRSVDATMRQADPFAPIALLCIPSHEAATFRLLKRLLYGIGKTGTVVFRTEKRFAICLGGFKDNVFDRRWNERELGEFLRKRFRSRLEALTPDMFEVFSELKLTFVHIFISPEKKLDDFANFVNMLPLFQYSYSLFDPDDQFAEKFRVRNLKAPIVVYYNPITEFQVTYKGPFAIREISEWMSKIDEELPPEIDRTRWLWGVALAGVALCILGLLRCRLVRKAGHFPAPGGLSRIKGFFR
jgi:hypothetical protein